MADLERMDELEKERNYLLPIRSLLDDDRFRRWFAGVKNRFEKTVGVMEAVEPENHCGHANIRGQRETYAHEIRIIETASERIKEIDSELAILNKRNKKKPTGIAVQSSAVRPKE